jgi:outer membrane protein
MKRILLLFFVVLLSFSSIAQIDTTARKWTLREIIDYAIAHNLTVKRSTYAVEGGEINFRQSKAVMLPSVNASGSYGSNWGRTIDPTTNNFTTNRVESSNLSTNGSLLLWNGFRLFYGMKQSDTELDALNEDMIKARNDVILNVITLYLNVVFNKELHAVAQFQLRSSQEQLARTKRLSDAGSVPLSDVLNLEAQVATNEVNVIQQENALNLSLLQLKQALQLPSSTPMDVELPQLDIQNELGVNKSAEEIFEIATMSMPEIKAAELRKKSSAYALRSSKGSLYPRLSINGSFSTNYSDQFRRFYSDGTSTTVTPIVGYAQDGFNTPVLAPNPVTVPGGEIRVPGIGDQFQENRGRNIGLTLQIPIFNGLSVRSNVQRAAINKEIANINLIEIKNSLRQTVETAYNNANAAIKTYESTEKQVKARDEAFRMTKQRYNLGAVNFVDYQIAENNLFQAQSDLLRAKYDFIFRKKVLDFYQGLPLGL